MLMFKNILTSTITTEVQRTLVLLRHAGEYMLVGTNDCAAALRIQSQRSGHDEGVSEGKRKAAAALHYFDGREETAIVCKEKMTGSAGTDRANLSA